LKQVNQHIVFLILFLQIGLVRAQNYADPRRFYFQQYSVENGLPQSQVNSIFEDSRGFLWFATQGGGVARFDGSKFLQYEEKEGLAGQIATCITEDDKGRMWFGTSWGGLTCFDGKNFKIFSRENGFTTNEVKSLIFDPEKSRVWVGLHWCLAYIENDVVVRHPDFNQLDVVSMAITNEGELAVATSNGLFLVGEDNKARLVPSTLDQAIRHVTVDSVSLWITSETGLFRLRTSDMQIMELPSVITNCQDLDFSSLSSTHIDASGQLWIASESDGLFLYKGDKIFHFTPENGLTDKNVQCVFSDRSGQLWVGTRGSGVLRFSDFAFSNYFGLQGLGLPDIFGITTDMDGVLWVGAMSEGLFRFDGKAIRKYSQKDGLPSPVIRQIVVARNGDLLLATKEGFCIFDGTRFKVFTEDQGLSSRNIRCLTQTKDGKIWLGTAGGGLVMMEGNKLEIFTVTNGLPHDYVHSLLEDSKGNLWIGTGAGLTKYADGIFSSYDGKEGLCNSYVGSMAEDRFGNIWVGTDKCISRFNGRRFTNYDVSDGLGSNTIYLLATDHSGSLIVGTNKGFDVVSFSAYGQISSIKNYTHNDGFLGIECNNKAVHVDANGVIWFGTVKGLIRFDPNEEPEEKVRPYIHISDVRLFHDTKWKKDQNYKAFDWFDLPIEPVFRHDQNSINFEFIGICQRYPETLEYSYMLEGFDKKWSPLSSSTLATYSNLAPGEYLFRVKARSKSGLWSIPEARYSFSIEPAFYQTWWFFLLLLVSLVYGVYYFNTFMQRNVLRQNQLLEEKVNVRTREILKQKEEKELLLKEIHHRVKNNLQVIVSLLNIHSDYVKDPESIALLEDSKSRIKSMALIHEKLYEGKNFSKVNIGEYLDTLVKELVETYGTDTRIQIDRSINADNFGFDTIIPLGLLLNEIVSNSLKYAFPGKEEGVLYFHLKGEGKKFELLIGDNGIGIDRKVFFESNKTLGVDLIRILTEQLNGEIELLEGQGTRYLIRFESIDKNRI